MRTPLLLYGLALIVRLVLIWHFPDPAYPDASYYVDVARALHAGSGFNVDFVWIFPEVGGHIPTDPTLPIPSNAHWMPLASIIQVPFLAILGPSAFASALPFALVGATAAPLTWAIARDAGARPIVGQASGILTAVPLLSLVYMVQPDNFSLYQPLVAGALWMGARGLKGSPRSFALAGLLAGVATLSRNDGLLVLGAIVLAFLWYRWRRWRAWGAGMPNVPVRAIVACIGLFVFVMAPWWARQMAVFGSLSPSTASGKVFFIREIAEWNSITIPATLDHLLGMGIMPLLGTRIGGLVAATMIYVTLIAGFVLAPLMVIGAWARRRSPDFRPFFLYALALFGFSTIVSAVHVPGGTFIHSAVALAPHSYILAIEGIVLAVGWIAARRPSWDPTIAIRVFIGATIAFAAFAAFAGTLLVHSSWEGRARRFAEVAGALDRSGAAATDRVMSIDAAGTRYWTGRGGVVLVNDPLDTIEDVARAYDIDWLVLDRGDSVAAVAPILDGGPLPDWLGDPILEVGSPVQLAIYPVLSDP